jgi:hypothetical protein
MFRPLADWLRSLPLHIDAAALRQLPHFDLFGFVSYHEPDADVRSHMALVYSADEEIRWNHSDPSSRIVLHVKSFTPPYTILPYESLTTQPGEHVFVVDQGGWNWIEQAFAAEHVEVKPIGSIWLRGGICSLSVAKDSAALRGMNPDWADEIRRGGEVLRYYESCCRTHEQTQRYP